MSISKSIWIRKQMAILALHVSTSMLHFSIRLSAGSDGFFGLRRGQKLADGAFLQHVEEESLKQVMEIWSQLLRLLTNTSGLVFKPQFRWEVNISERLGWSGLACTDPHVSFRMFSSCCRPAPCLQAELFPAALHSPSSHWEHQGGKSSLPGGCRISGGWNTTSTGRSYF